MGTIARVSIGLNVGSCGMQAPAHRVISHSNAVSTVGTASVTLEHYPRLLRHARLQASLALEMLRADADTKILYDELLRQEGATDAIQVPPPLPPHSDKPALTIFKDAPPLRPESTGRGVVKGYGEQVCR
jgi:hypothetical protein